MKEQQEQPPILFRPAMDWWVAGLVVLFLIMVVCSIPLTIAYSTRILTSVVIVAVLIVTFLIVLDKAFFTRYILLKDGLVIEGQLYIVFIPYRNMTSIHNGGFRHLFSLHTHRRFALSTHSLVISLHDYHWKTISISPVERQAFIHLFLTHMEAERGMRTVISKPRKRTKKR